MAEFLGLNLQYYEDYKKKPSMQEKKKWKIKILTKNQMHGNRTVVKMIGKSRTLEKFVSSQREVRLENIEVFEAY